MLNLTVLSFSLLSSYSISPIFTGNSNYILNSQFKFFYSTLLFNINNLRLEKSTFSHGIGAVVISENTKKLYIKDVNENYADLVYTSENITYIANENSDVTKTVFIIRDCLFLQMQVSEKDALIQFTGNPTVYITSLTFDACKVKKSLIYLNSKATTLSHICCSKLRKTDGSDALFLYSSTKVDSFFKMVYSTITGTNEYMSNVQRIMYFHGTSAFKVQCMNVSNFIIDKQETYEIFEFTSPSCLHMLMNTYHDLDGNAIFIISNSMLERQNGFYIANNNFLNNKFYKGCLSLKLARDSYIYITDCAFTCQDGSTGNFINRYEGGDSKRVMIVNCVFSKSLNDFNHGWAESQNCKVEEPTKNVLAHYVVEGYCDGVVHEHAYGCNNDTCPADKGCEANAFKFPSDEVSYTEKFHSDIDTPTPSPTVAFSQSIAFTYSSLFTLSSIFTKSNKFTFSKIFTKSSKFTKSDYFTRSKSFTKSAIFSKSKEFTKSTVFTSSKDFTKTSGFTKTIGFTETSGFSNTDLFSKSKFFSKSSDFSKSGDFTNSISFSCSEGFTKTSLFSETEKFSKSDLFSKSEYFSESTFFSMSKNFSKSDFFSNSLVFSSSLGFSDTSDFSRSELFSGSLNFTQSHIFSPSLHFDATHTFTPSNAFTLSEEFNASLIFSSSFYFTLSAQFTYSTEFTPSVQFAETVIFTFSDHFTKSKYFTYSNKFSDSDSFTKSLIFSDSRTFTPSNHFDATHSFTPSLTFTESNPFSESYYFTSSRPFTISNYFTSSKSFTLSNKFTKSYPFTPSNHFTSSKPFISSNKFTSSRTFTGSNSFTSSLSFTSSRTFTNSEKFNSSMEFTSSKTLRNNVAINISSDQKGRNWKVIGGAIAASMCAVGIIIAIIAFIVIRHRRYQPSSDMFEELNPVEDTHSSITYNNVLHGLDMEDDPFEDDFNDYHHH